MKKKGILFLVICLVLMFATLLTACSLVKINEERQANHVVATVTVDLASEDEFGNTVKVLGDDYNYVVSLDITRRDLMYTANYAINYYSQLYSQYGLTYNYDIESILDSSLKTLRTQKYNTIRAMGDMLVNSKTTKRYDALYCLTEEYKANHKGDDGKYILTPEGILTQAERYTVIGKVNEQFETRLEGYLNEDEEESNEEKEKLDQLYDDGYFVSSVAIGRYNEETGKVEPGLYKTYAVDDNNDDTKDLDYKKIYAIVTLFKEVTNEETNVTTVVTDTVNLPIEDSALTVAADAKVTGTKYVSGKTATITFSGRVYAEKTEDDDTGYELQTFTSNPEKYTLYSAKTAPTKSEKEEEDKLETLRYVTGDALKEIEATFFVADPKSDKFTKQDLTDNEKDAYRRLRDYLNSSKVGYTTENDYYNGLGYYYLSEFESYILEAEEYELGATVTKESLQAKEIEDEYNYLVLKDKVNYENLTEEEQVTKFFDTIKGSDNGLSNVYYVPIEALCNTKFEIKSDDKAYSALFDNGALIAAEGEKYKVTVEDGKYYMPYAYQEADGSYTINMFFTTHILVGLDNVNGLSDLFSYYGFARTSEEKLQQIQDFIADDMIKTAPQLLSFLEAYAEAEEAETTSEMNPDQLYAFNEDGSLKTETVEEVIAKIKARLKEAEATEGMEVLDEFTKLMEQYNDDPSSANLTNSGYLVSLGDMNNGWYADFTATAIDMYFNLLKDGEPTGYIANGEGEYAESNYALSDYGIHFMYLTFAPLYQVKIDANGGIGLETKLNLDGDTRKTLIEDSLVKTKKDEKYTEWQSTTKDETVDKYSEVDNKYYKKIIKDAKD